MRKYVDTIRHERQILNLGSGERLFALGILPIGESKIPKYDRRILILPKTLLSKEKYKKKNKYSANS